MAGVDEIPIDGGPGPVGVTVCRGCCCGDATRDPGLDHEAQLRRLRRFAADRPGRVAVRTSECLGPCSQANVVVVRPTAAARRRGARPVWLALVRDGGSLDDLERWVEAGGPGTASMPDTLALHVFTPPAAPPVDPTLTAGGADRAAGLPGPGSPSHLLDPVLVRPDRYGLRPRPRR